MKPTLFASGLPLQGSFFFKQVDLVSYPVYMFHPVQMKRTLSTLVLPSGFKG